MNGGACGTGPALDCRFLLWLAAYARQRSDRPARANPGTEKLRFLFRLVHDLRCPDSRRRERAAPRLGASVAGRLTVTPRFPPCGRPRCARRPASAQGRDLGAPGPCPACPPQRLC